MSFRSISSFTAGKISTRNEDKFAISHNVIVLADGATDKTGRMYGSKSGGEIAAEAVLQAALTTDLNGQDLVRKATELLNDQYKVHNPDTLLSSHARAASTMIVIRVCGDKAVITAVGDSYLRINQDRIIGSEKLIDKENALKRKCHIDSTGDVAGGRAAILHILQTQHNYQNKSREICNYGYGAIDGTEVPAEFVYLEELPLRSLKTLEIASDGYHGRFPSSTPSIAAFESDHAHVELTDPDKCITVLSTKSRDDRTIIIVEIMADKLDDARD